MRHRSAWFSSIAAAALWLAAPAVAQPPAAYGPYNAEFIAGGDGLSKPIPDMAEGARLPVGNAWTLHGWVEPEAVARGTTLVAGFGDPASGRGRFLTLADGVPQLVTSAGRVSARRPLVAGRWYHVAASASGGTARLYVDGREVARGPASDDPVAAIAQLAPRAPAAAAGAPFAGRIAGFTMTTTALDPRAIAALARDQPDPALIQFEQGSPNWPIQVRQQLGQVTPQDAWTLPRAEAPFSKPVAKPVVKQAALVERSPGLWAVNGWRLAEAPKVRGDGAALSRAGFDDKAWYQATVPGTVLTTLVDRGVYPDPAYGLNNLAIPESLNKQDYWYRSEFDAPADADGRRMFLTFNGVNYAADIWLNGARLGAMKGAFIRGRFDVTGKLLPGRRNAVAVRVSPPPHPGLAQEESLTAGNGENGGMMMLDGPTFVATEGWDWIPSVRDRNTGLWQGVELAATGDLVIGDAQVVTTLPLPDNSRADVEISVPLTNLSDRPVAGEVRAAFDGITVAKQVTLAPRATTTVKLAPAEFPQLAVANPKLWWPNGYGEPALHMLRLTSSIDGRPSDTKDVRFGMRQVTYEISLIDQAGRLRRVEMDLSKARALGQQIVDGTHDGIRKVPGGWAASLVPGAEASPAVKPADPAGMTPYLLIKVNGVRIAARGGNVGMDDWMKRVGREKLEPYFRLHRDAHMNIVRNWVGQSTEEVFYDLADENGLMVLNDFWASTQNYNVETDDIPLFTSNAEDVVKRFRNHPSIVAWFGRNEGVPQPKLNEALQAIVNRYDGTRFYMGSSNTVNLQNSGPYNWREPETYFTEHAKGFAVELGTPSFPTLESWKRAIPAADRWPISDSWAYHDWHQIGNGGVGTYMASLTDQFGAATSLEDFERKAQMLQYVSYRAIFEGFNAGLWKENSGRMLWMTQPAWPSSAWQIFSSDYDTHASFYGVKKASEPVHVQMNLPDYKVVLVNNPRTALGKATVRARVYDLRNRLLAERSAAVSAPAGKVVEAFTLDLKPLLARGVVLVRLEAVDAGGRVLSSNTYWQGRDNAAMRALGELPPAALSAEASSRREGEEVATSVTLANRTGSAALATKLTMMNADGGQILPAYFSDNYVSLLPGESRTIEVRYPASAAKGARVTLRGWNVTPATVVVR